MPFVAIIAPNTKSDDVNILAADKNEKSNASGGANPSEIIDHFIYVTIYRGTGRQCSCTAIEAVVVVPM